eukprot:TRINITY_DN3661_c0_g1_i1.p1 TRINITY_DN3661_c0_g1~~TRINITY_DN3661_c0_g1_i1.p1  ORF type:complete len:491 (-),score=156.46 TRINITY_DN3661_c0_g1_i1:70-1542(-)
MCTIRGLWILNVSINIQPTFLFTKRFATVEKRFKIREANKYVPIPSDIELLPLFLEQLHQLESSIFEYILPSGTSLGSASGTRSKWTTLNYPIFSLLNSSIYPFVYIFKDNYFFIVLPSIEAETKKVPIEEQLEIVMSIELLNDLFIKQTLSLDPEHLLLSINSMIPFGRPFEVNYEKLKYFLEEGIPSKVSPVISKNRPNWKYQLYQGKQSIDLILFEQLKVVIHNNQLLIKGAARIECKAKLEDVTGFSFDLLESKESKMKSEIFILPSEPQVIMTDISGGKKFSTIPPLTVFNICSFNINDYYPAPIVGNYIVQENNKLFTITINLQLSSNVRNEFEFCNVLIPFVNKGIINSFDFDVSSGSVSLESNKHALKWTIGTKFPYSSRELYEVTLQTVITFSNDSILIGDPFLVDGNCFIELFFKINNYSISGITIDPKSINLTNQSKCNLNIQQSIIPNEYLIWNQSGDARINIELEKQLQNLKDNYTI